MVYGKWGELAPKPQSKSALSFFSHFKQIEKGIDKPILFSLF
jgi:hypothetical protein